MEQTLPRSPWKELALLIILTAVFWSPDNETIKLKTVLFKPPTLWYSVIRKLIKRLVFV